jgi:hypothetical protein
MIESEANLKPNAIHRWIWQLQTATLQVSVTKESSADNEARSERNTKARRAGAGRKARVLTPFI